MVAIARILCPVDLSDVSRHAFVHAAALARWYESQLFVLHAFTAFRPPVAVSQFPGNTPLLPPVQPDEVKEDVRRFCDPLISAGLTPTLVVEDGDPVKTIVRVAQERSADLLVIGTHGRGGFERLMLGSVTEKVLRTLRCPVMTVPPSIDGGAGPVAFKTILCAIDFGPSAIRALDYAVSLAEEADARLILLHVLESFADVSYLGDTAGFAVPDFHRQLESAALERLKALLPADARSWCRPDARVVTGKAYQEILQTARETNAELIVMGVQGRSAVDLLLFGSTTHHVIREAGCPVLTLRAAEN